MIYSRKYIGKLLHKLRVKRKYEAKLRKVAPKKLSEFELWYKKGIQDKWEAFDKELQARWEKEIEDETFLTPPQMQVQIVQNKFESVRRQRTVISVSHCDMHIRIFIFPGETFPSLLLKHYQILHNKKTSTSEHRLTSVESDVQLIREKALSNYQLLRDKYNKLLEKQADRVDKDQFIFSIIHQWELKSKLYKPSIAPNGIIVRWVHFWKINDLRFINEYTIVMTRGCHFIFADPYTGHKETYKICEPCEGERIDCFCTDPSKSLIAISGSKSYQIVVMEYPYLNKLAVLDDAFKEDYLCLSMGGGDIIYALRGFPSFRMTIWNYKSLELLHTISNAIASNAAFLLANPVEPKCYVINTNEGSRVSKYTVHTFGRVCAVNELEIDFNPPKKLCHACFSPRNNIYFVDCFGNIYGVNEKSMLYMIFNWRIKICEVGVLGFPMKPIHPTFVQWYHKGLLVLGPSGYLRYFEMQAQSNGKKKIYCMWEIKRELTRTHLACSRSGGSAVFHCEKKGLCYIEDGQLTSTEDHCPFQIEHMAFLNPDCKYFVTGSEDYLHVWSRLTGKLMNKLFVKIKVGSITSHPNYPYIVITSSETGSFRVIDLRFVRKPNQLYDMWVSSELIPEIRFSPDGEKMTILTPENRILMFKADPRVFCFEEVGDLQITIQSTLTLRAPKSSDLHLLTLDVGQKSKGRSHFTLFSFPIRFEGDCYCSDSYAELEPCYSPECSFFALTKNHEYLHKILLDLSGPNLDCIKLASIQLVQFLPTVPKIQCFGNHLVGWGKDGLIYFWNDSDLNMFSVTMNHHRFDGGTKAVIVDKHCRHFLTLGEEGVIGCYTFPKKICGHHVHPLNPKTNYIPLPYRRLRSLIPEYEAGLMPYDEWFRDMKVYKQIKMDKIELSNLVRDLIALKYTFNTIIYINDIQEDKESQLTLDELCITRCTVKEVFGTIIEKHKAQIIDTYFNMVKTYMESFSLMKIFFWNPMTLHLFSVQAIQQNFNCSAYVMRGMPNSFYRLRYFGVYQRIIDVQAVNEPPFIPWTIMPYEIEPGEVDFSIEYSSTSESESPNLMSIKGSSAQQLGSNEELKEPDCGKESQEVQNENKCAMKENSEDDFVEEEETIHTDEEDNVKSGDKKDEEDFDEDFDFERDSSDESVESLQEDPKFIKEELKMVEQNESNKDVEGMESIDDVDTISSQRRSSNLFDLDSLLLKNINIQPLDESSELVDTSEPQEANNITDFPKESSEFSPKSESQSNQVDESEALKEDLVESEEEKPEEVLRENAFHTTLKKKKREFKIDPLSSPRSRAKMMKKMLKIQRVRKKKKVSVPSSTRFQILTDSMNKRHKADCLSDIVSRAVKRMLMIENRPQKFQLAQGNLIDYVEKRLEALESTFDHHLEIPLPESPNMLEANLILCADSLIPLFKDTIFKVKKDFNRQMVDMKMAKIKEIELTNTNNNEVKELIVALRDACCLAPHLLPIVPPPIELMDSEVPEALISVKDSEIPAMKILNIEEEAILQAELEKSQELERLFKLDAWKREALMDMMDGVLTLTWKDILKRDIPVPPCVAQKNVEEFTLEEKEETKAYLEKVSDLRNQCVYYVKKVQEEIKTKIRETEKSHMEHNRKLQSLLELKHQLITAICSERLKVSRLSCRKANQCNILEFMQILRGWLYQLNALMKRLKKNVVRLRREVVKLNKKYNSFRENNLKLKGKFKHNFDANSMKALNFDKIMSLYQYRPPYNLINKATIAELRELAASGLDHSKAPYLAPLFDEYFGQIVQMNSIVNRPPGIDKATWDLIVIHRREKIIAELKMEACKRDLASGKEVLKHFEESLQRIHHDFSVTKSALMKTQNTLRQLYKFAELQLVLPHGHFEVDSTSSHEFIYDAVLIDVSLIDDLNFILTNVLCWKLTAGQRLVAILDETGTKEFEHLLLRCVASLMQRENKLIKKFTYSSYLQRYLNVVNKTGAEPDLVPEMTDIMKEEEQKDIEKQRIVNLKAEAKNKRTNALKKQRLIFLKDRLESLLTNEELEPEVPQLTPKVEESILDEEITANDIILPYIEVNLKLNDEVQSKATSIDKFTHYSESNVSDKYSSKDESEATEYFVSGMCQKIQNESKTYGDGQEEIEEDSCLDFELESPLQGIDANLESREFSTPSPSQLYSLTSSENESEATKEDVEIQEGMSDDKMSPADISYSPEKLMVRFIDDGSCFSDGSKKPNFLVPLHFQTRTDFENDYICLKDVRSILKFYFNEKYAHSSRDSIDMEEMQKRRKSSTHTYYEKSLEQSTTALNAHEYIVEEYQGSKGSVSSFISDEYSDEDDSECDDSDENKSAALDEVGPDNKEYDISSIHENSSSSQLSEIVNDVSFMKLLEKNDAKRKEKQQEEAKSNLQFVTYMPSDNFKRTKSKKLDKNNLYTWHQDQIDLEDKDYVFKKLQDVAAMLADSSTYDPSLPYYSQFKHLPLEGEAVSKIKEDGLNILEHLDSFHSLYFETSEEDDEFHFDTDPELEFYIDDLKLQPINQDSDEDGTELCEPPDRIPGIYDVIAGDDEEELIIPHAPSSSTTSSDQTQPRRLMVMPDEDLEEEHMIKFAKDRRDQDGEEADDYSDRLGSESAEGEDYKKSTEEKQYLKLHNYPTDLYTDPNVKYLLNELHKKQIADEETRMISEQNKITSKPNDLEEFTQFYGEISEEMMGVLKTIEENFVSSDEIFSELAPSDDQQETISTYNGTFGPMPSTSYISNYYDEAWKQITLSLELCNKQIKDTAIHQRKIKDEKREALKEMVQELNELEKSKHEKLPVGERIVRFEYMKKISELINCIENNKADIKQLEKGLETLHLRSYPSFANKEDSIN